MSISLMTLAFKMDLPTMQKFVLVALCDSANDQGECYPSIPALADKCSMGVRTVQEAISALETAGVVRREFRPGRSTVYWLTPAPAAPRTSRTPHVAHHTPAPAAPPPPHQPHHTPADCAPITVIEPSIEPSGKQKKKRASAHAPACPDDVDQQTWNDWLMLRSKKRAPVTETVLAEARNESEKAGISLTRFLAVWCVRGSQGLQADWLKPAERAAIGISKQAALEARNKAVADEFMRGI